MNRMEEYNALLAEMDPPAELDVLVRQAMARERRRRAARRVALCACAPAVVLVVFVALVNLLPGFAYACGRLPGLRALVHAVAMSPSLSAAVENQYVQPINQQQEQNGVTMRVEYVIVDQKQLNIFYTLNSEEHQHMDPQPTITAADGSSMQGFIIASSNYDEPNGTLRSFTVEFVEGDMPSALLLNAEVHILQVEGESQPPVKNDRDGMLDGTLPEKPQPVASFIFPLRFDPAFTQKGEVITLNQTFHLDGQTLIADSVEIYPTHIRFNLKDDPANTAWLKELRFYLTDERGNRFDPPANGINAMGSPDSPMMASYRLESSYFAGSKKLTLHITGATWLDKEHRRMRVDLAGGKTEWLPQGAALEQARREGRSWALRFSGDLRNGKIMAQLFDHDYYDEQGNRYEVHEWSSSGDERDKARYIVKFTLIDYPYDVVYLAPSFSRVTAQTVPVEIQVK